MLRAPGAYVEAGRKLVEIPVTRLNGDAHVRAEVSARHLGYMSSRPR
jgi:hypothetical protein